MATKKPPGKKPTTRRTVGGTPSPAKRRPATEQEPQAHGGSLTRNKRRAAGKADVLQAIEKVAAAGKKDATRAGAKPGRPSSHNPALADAICAGLMNGQSLRTVCSFVGMPAVSTVLRWIHDDLGGFRSQYARAREVQAEVLADEVVEIADAPPRMETIEWEDVTTKSGKKKRVPVMVAVDGADVANRRLRADARKWYASKVAPKKFGEHLNIEGGELLVTFRDLTGRKGEAPPQGDQPA